MLFAIYCVDKPGHAHVRGANRAAHLDYAHAKPDIIVLGGPLMTEDGSGMVGSMMVLDLPDRAAAEAHLAGDPYVKAGLFESVIIRPFRKVLP